ncbi:hypothetical protein LTR40_006935 [Exophiala xenobiotica]|nr:hypothetical protein LTR40_006935 [Exophiala xenobiotica]
MSFSFPQPEDVYDGESSVGDEVQTETPEEEEVLETTNIEPIATSEIPRITGVEEQNVGGVVSPKAIPVSADKGLDGTRNKLSESARGSAMSPDPASFQTAREHALAPPGADSPLLEGRRSGLDTDQSDTDGQDLNRTETSSRTPLLPPQAGPSATKFLRDREPSPIRDDSSYTLKRSATGVRFKVAEGVQQRRRRIENKAERAIDRVADHRLRRNTLKEGTIVKMERMLVRCDLVMQSLPEDFDENESQKVELRLLEKWREYMVVARKSKKQDVDDFRLQIYKTRVIPEIDTESTRKKPQHEIRLDPKTTRVNMYSSLDKTVVIWHPYKKGTRVFVMRPSSTAHSVECVANLLESDGFINLCYVRKVRTIKWGASPADDTLEAGSDSDVDFHQDVSDTRMEDGTTKQIDDDRVFEILLDNGLVIRLQAYSKQTRDEWISRLKKLVKYWKLRTAAEMDTYKAIRRANLQDLNIDEELEAIIGQFAKKWEVSRSQASPELYNMCGISVCRSITMAGPLYLKTRRRSTFHRSQVILTGGKLLIYQATLRKRTGEQIRHIHQEKQQVVDLRDCYVYSGLIVQDDLLYQNKTFDANHPGMASLPRVYLEDGWTSADVDVMTCFVVWMNRRKGWFRTAAPEYKQPILPSDGNDNAEDDGNGKMSRGKTRAKLRRVGQLGVPGRGMVFKCRSRAERDRWVLSVASEIERVVEHEVEELGDGGEFRFDN